MKNALVLGTNAGQADIIVYLRDAGWRVHACGKTRSGPGCDLAHVFHPVDTVNVEEVKRLAAGIGAEIVTSVSSDSAIRTVTRVSEDLGLPALLNSEIIDLFHYKDRLRRFLHEARISTVRYAKAQSTGDLEAWDLFPCVVKPSDSQGQRGLAFVENREDLFRDAASALSFSPSASIIVEEYLPGIEISTNMIVQGGRVLVNEFTERLVFGREFFGLPKGHGIPVRRLSGSTIAAAAGMTEKLVEALGIEDAVLYIQMKAVEGDVRVIEVAPRLDGCHIWRLIKTARGYDLRQDSIDCLLRKPIRHSGAVAESHGGYTLFFHHAKTGSLFDPEEFEVPEDAVYNEFRYERGQAVESINGRLEVVGYFIRPNESRF